MNTNSVFLLVLLFFPLAAYAQNESDIQENSDSESESNKPYEVVITGRVTRAHLRDLIVDVEDDFFEKFNELNLDDEYDMYCYEYAPTMSHIKKRACEPMFMMKYRADQSSNALFAIGGGGDPGYISWLNAKVSGVYLESDKVMRKNLSRYYDTLVEKMEELTRTEQELAEIAHVMEQLKYRLENY